MTQDNNKNEASKTDNQKLSNETSEVQPAEAKEKKQPVQVTITDVELELLKKEAAEYKDKYFRVLAESENARKRLQKERQELIQYAIQNLIVDFLNPIDHMENALEFTQQASDDVKHWALGFQMILNQFKDVLANNGVTIIKAEGTAFDPHHHEAIEMVETLEHPSGIVVSQTLKGYRMGERTIRPARVKVSKSPESKNEKQADNNKQDELNQLNRS